MEFFGMLFALIVLTTLINRFFDYRKTKIRSLSESQHDEEVQAVKEELAQVKEMVADVLLELERQTHMLPSPRPDGEKTPPPPS